MQWIIRLIVAIIFGANFGALSALWLGGMISGGPRIGNAINVDEWRSDWSIGSENADPYVRARVARNGLMGLRKEEAVYFLKTEDDAGEALSEACTYRVRGGDLPAAWWSITLYDGQSMLPSNEDSALSYDQSRAGAAEWEALIADKRPEDEGAWISSRNAGAFDLTLRLYVPDQALLDTPGTVLSPPTVERIECAGEAL